MLGRASDYTSYRITLRLVIINIVLLVIDIYRKETFEIRYNTTSILLSSKASKF